MAIQAAIRSSLRWTRGPAAYENGFILMRIGSQTTILMLDAVEVELSRIHTPDDAVAFVGRFGLLRSGRQAGQNWEAGPDVGDPLHGLGSEIRPTTDADREPYSEFASTADDLRDILRLMKLVRSAGIDHDTTALNALRQWAATSQPFADSQHRHAPFIMPILKPETDFDFLRAVTTYVSDRLNDGLATDGLSPTISVFGQPPDFIDPRESPDRLTLAAECQTLRSFAYWSLAQKLIARYPISTCPACNHDFPVQYRGKQRVQRFCSRNCARRAKYREDRAGGNQTDGGTSGVSGN